MTIHHRPDARRPRRVRRVGGVRRARRAVGVASLLAACSLAACAGPEEVSLSAGSCLPATAKVQGRREANPPTVGCDEPHRYETYAVGDLDADALGWTGWPGQDAVDAAARQYCYETFEPNVGFHPRDMGDDIRVLYITPTAQSWANQRDREVECLLIFTEDRTGRLARPETESTAP